MPRSQLCITHVVPMSGGAMIDRAKLLLLLLLAPLRGSALATTSSPPTAEQQCLENGAISQACGFETVTTDAFAANPVPWDQWRVPLLVTGASESSDWSAPFQLLERLDRGELDDTLVAVGSGAGTALFEGAGSSSMTLGQFKKQMARDDVVFDTQNSAAGRHAELPIPGIPVSNHNSRAADPWWNVVSVGTEDAGLALHEHGAAWLALGSGGGGGTGGMPIMGKQWVAWPPFQTPAHAFEGRFATQAVSSWFDEVSFDTAAACGGTYEADTDALHSSQSTSSSQQPQRLNQMLSCLQPPGSVVLLPQGWAHATRNVAAAAAPTVMTGTNTRPHRTKQQHKDAGGATGSPAAVTYWAVGRQRQWPAESRLEAVEPLMDPINPADSPPLGLLHAGLALKSLSWRQPSPAVTAAYAEPAVGMLLTAAGLAPSHSSSGAAAILGTVIKWLQGLFGTISSVDEETFSSATVLPLVQLKARFGLLERHHRGRIGDLASRKKHWAGPQGETAARWAALAAEKQLLAELKMCDTLSVNREAINHSPMVTCKVSALMVAEGLEWLRGWWEEQRNHEDNENRRRFGPKSELAVTEEADAVIARLHAGACAAAQHAEAGATKPLLLQRLAQWKEGCG